MSPIKALIFGFSSSCALLSVESPWRCSPNLDKRRDAFEIAAANASYVSTPAMIVDNWAKSNRFKELSCFLTIAHLNSSGMITPTASDSSERSSISESRF